MTRILISSNAPWSSSGYGQQTALLAPRLAAAGHQVAISAFYGLEGGMMPWAHPSFPEHVIPCYPTDWTRFGAMMLPEYARHHGGGDPGNCVVLTNQDMWPLTPGLPGLKSLRLAAWAPIDHDPAPPQVVHVLKESGAKVASPSLHGQAVLAKEGIEARHVPYGIDTSIFRPPSPEEKRMQRAALNIPEDAFVVGMIGNNQGLPSRKSFPLAFEAFKRFHDKHPDAILFVHADIFGRNGGVNLIQLAKAVGIPDTVIRTSDQLLLHLGIPQAVIANVVKVFDVYLQPSMGEGFGIPAVEAQATGVPVILSDFTAMSELCGAGWLVGGERFWDQGQGAFQFMPNVKEIVHALRQAYDKAASMGTQAREFAVRYDVNTVFENEWLPVLEEFLAPREIEPLRLAA